MGRLTGLGNVGLVLGLTESSFLKGFNVAEKAKETGHLVLGRFPGESIMVGDDIMFHIVEFHGGQVKVGIFAPRDVTIHRREVWLAIKGNVRAQAG